MATIIFSGTVTEAEGAATHLSVAGPNHYFFSKTYTRSFDEPLNLEPGVYQVFVSTFTDGKFRFNVTGNFLNIDPDVPDDYDEKTNEAYRLTV